MRTSPFLFTLALQFFAAACMAQPAAETMTQKLGALLKDAPSGFAASLGEKMGERQTRVFYQSKLRLGGTDAIVADSAKGKKTFMHLLKSGAEGGGTNIPALQALIEKVSAMQELAKAHNLKFERKPMEGGGMRNTLHNEAGVLLMEFRHTTAQQILEVVEP
jgi:hypothetical protein